MRPSELQAFLAMHRVRRDATIACGVPVKKLPSDVMSSLAWLGADEDGWEERALNEHALWPCACTVLAAKRVVRCYFERTTMNGSVASPRLAHMVARDRRFVACVAVGAAVALRRDV